MFKLKQGLKGVGGLRHSGKEKIKAQFDVVIKKLINIQDLNGKAVALAWKRGTSTGSTKEVVVANGEAVWNEKITVKGTLFGDPENEKFDEKDIVFSLKQDSKVIAKLNVDLSHYAKHESMHHEDFQFFKKPRSPTLQVSIHTRWLKLNSKLLVKQEDAGREKGFIDIDGQAYGLKTDDALTDTSIDTGTGSWEEDDADLRDDPFTTTTMYEAETRRTHDEMEALRKQLRLVEGESSQRAKTIELQEKEILELRRQLEIIEKRCSESEELVQRGYELESFMRQQLALAQQEHKDELNMVKVNHKDELQLLRKELETERTRAQLSSLMLPASVEQVAPAEPAKTELAESEQPTTNIEPMPNEPARAVPAQNTEESSKLNDLEDENSALRNKCDSLEGELQQSALSLINMTDKLAHKDSRIESLLSTLSSLQSQLAFASIQPPAKPSSPSKHLNSSSSHKQLQVPLFTNPLVDQHHQLLVVLGLLVILSLCTLL